MKITSSGLSLLLLLSACGVRPSAGTESAATSQQQQAPPPAPSQPTGPPAEAAAEALAFPGAEGFGRHTTGGRGGKVYVVTTLNDTGPGSLREAIRKKEPRIIVFAVAGTIALESPLDINTGNLTIAGQSAPGDGICLKNYPMKIKGDNVIVRYMRFRMGDEQQVQDDAISCIRNKNIIIDHCSMSWATDECASFYDNENFTLQWSIISESLNKSVHEKGDHGYGGIWGGKGASFHHNLLADHSSRTPRFCGSRYHKQPEQEVVDFRNNVLFNWVHNSAYGGEKGNHNLVNNYYKSGPATQKSKQDRIVNPYQPYGNFYVAGNQVVGFPEVSQNNWQGGVQTEHPDSTRLNQPVAFAPITEHSAEEAYRLVLQKAGASLRPDAVDRRIVAQVQSATATTGENRNGIIDSQTEVGGWPELKGAAPQPDADADGMPDAWEKQHRLNPADAADAAGQTIQTGYSNVEVYLNGLVR